MNLRENYYISDVLRKGKHIANNLKFDHFLSECKDIDSIMEYDRFKSYIVRNKNKLSSKFAARAEFGDEGLLYGHRNAFFEYAGIASNKQRFLFPYFEHGADIKLQILPNVYEERYHSYVYQSPYKNETLHKIRPMCPVYNVGPYVLYAKQYYDEEKKTEIKKEMGRTALVFPAHTFEGAVVEHFDKKKFVSEVLSSFKNHYDTILICVYWKDVEDPVYDIFASEGAKLVSAGFRGDPNFIVRLRTIIELSDVVSSNLVGSYIGHSMALGRPFFMFNDHAKISDAQYHGSHDDRKRYLNTVDEIFDAFSEFPCSDESSKRQNMIYKKFWGGEEYFKSKEEARNMISLSDKLLKIGKWTSKGYTNAIQAVLRNEDDGYVSDSEKIILRNALGM